MLMYFIQRQQKMTLKQHLRAFTWIIPMSKCLFKVDKTETQTTFLKVVPVSLLLTLNRYLPCSSFTAGKNSYKVDIRDTNILITAFNFVFGDWVCDILN